MFFTDGLTDGEKTQRILSYHVRVPEESMEDINYQSETFRGTDTVPGQQLGDA